MLTFNTDFDLNLILWHTNGYAYSIAKSCFSIY